jgi:hypothetical protein
MSVRDHTALNEQADSHEYVVYNLTPNMWEEPWVRHLLADLPISCYEYATYGHLRRRGLAFAGFRYGLNLSCPDRFGRRVAWCAES